MARVALSEFRAKQLVFSALGRTYEGLSVRLSDKNYKQQLAGLPNGGLYVAKVDQAVKKRNKSGLVTVRRTKTEVLADLKRFAERGFEFALVEQFVPHPSKGEQYIALSRSGQGVEVSYSQKGGVDIEEHTDTLQKLVLPGEGHTLTVSLPDVDDAFLTALYKLFQESHMTLLEINPLIKQNGQYTALDAAVQVDSAAELFVADAWAPSDVRQAKSQQNKHERVVEELNAKSPASFNLKVLNPNGSYFLLLSGGGASVVVADELAHHGQYENIANYGEYSGGPNDDEVYIYAKELLALLLNSSATHKTLLIAGGVANFTDVGKTFKGIIRAMEEVATDMVKQRVRVFVRRGGPNQEAGLQAIHAFFEQVGIAHKVYGPDVSLARTVAEATGAKVA